MSLREAFIALIPYFVIAAFSTLLKTIFVGFHLVALDSVLSQLLVLTTDIILLLFPAATVISVSYFLSKNLGVNTIVGSILALASFSVHGHYLVQVNDVFVLSPANAAVYAIIIPALTCYGLKWVMAIWQPLFIDMPSVSFFLRKHFMLILPFIVVFFAMFAVMPLLNWLGEQLFYPLLAASDDASVFAELFQRMITIHSFWFFGIHGDNAYSMIFNQQFLNEHILPNLPAKVFYDTFVLLGGTGCFWGLILATLFSKLKSHERAIVKLSLPFSVFNFCEIILFAFPIVLNPIFLLPFFLAPICNFIIAYYFLAWGLIPYGTVELSWMTPVLINGWLVSEQIITPLFQLALILLNAAIYYPFLKFSYRSRNVYVAIDALERSFGVNRQFDKQSEQLFIVNQQKSLESNSKITKLLAELSQGRLLLYYQPQINVTTNQIYGYEALLRFKQVDGVIVGPYFLSTLVENKLGYLVDHWVLQQVEQDLKSWQQQGFEPKVSVNLNPDVLINKPLVNSICQRFSAFAGQVNLEIIESSYIARTQQVIEHIALLKRNGINTAIDDFGTGYSSLSLLTRLPVKTVKLDRSILLECKTEQGKVLYRHITTLFHELGLLVIAEGVETQEELAWVQSLKIDVVQGWYYAPAKPFDSITDFNSNWPN